MPSRLDTLGHGDRLRALRSASQSQLALWPGRIPCPHGSYRQVSPMRGSCSTANERPRTCLPSGRFFPILNGKDRPSLETSRMLPPAKATTVSRLAKRCLKQVESQAQGVARPVVRRAHVQVKSAP